MRRLAYVALGMTIITQGCVVMRDPMYVSYSPSSVVENTPDELGRLDNSGFLFSSSPVEAASAPTPEDKVARLTLVCPEFRPPVMPEPPRLTSVEFDKIDPRDNKALVEALTNHAQALYRYSQEYRARIQKEMLKHRKSCRSMYLLAPGS